MRAKLTLILSAFVYLLRCSDGSLYCGWTTDVERRLKVHNAGKASRYTSRRLPVQLVYTRRMSDRSAAMREEARIKRLSRGAKLALVRAPKLYHQETAIPASARYTCAFRP
jgi:putative endonuclease